ncbi:hypothetical protein EHQ46_16095 [Leptospira yanagawae]|uniref:Uncharacterized protein n=1 Tax=Leptospira yanagawae TaxID=293069 RepID=A0ABY2M120_9LEPT|nr:hypothetical protein [Leptospira yanagawae]TGL17708.1 hypothetical protein EHQ46_16095 [Leptospira yanagawae]
MFFDNLLANFAIELTNQKDEVVDETFIKNTLYGKDSPILKLNLFPLPRKIYDTPIDEYAFLFKSDWDLNKKVYKDICEKLRFHLFRELINEYKPDVIICLG